MRTILVEKVECLEVYLIEKWDASCIFTAAKNIATFQLEGRVSKWWESTKVGCLSLQKKIHFLPDSGFGLLLPSLRNFQRKQLQHQLNDNHRSQVVKIDYLQIVWVHLGILEHQLSLNESILICLWMCIFVSSVFKWSILGLFFVIFDLFEQTI